MNIVASLAWIGAGISLIGTGRYVIGIIKDGTRPRLASWIAWFVANVVLTIVAFLSGAYLAATFNALASLGNAGVLIAGAAKRTGERPTGKSDWTCLGVAAVCSAIIMIFPRLAMLGALLAMVANVIATWPTMQHAWKRPFAETWQLFAANAGASLLGLISVASVSGLRLTTIAGPLIAMLGNIALVSITLGRRYGTQIVEELQEEIAELEETVQPAEVHTLD
ncbi:MAG TPA: hypothetical protein VGO07_07295 [Candidatus Saccharimonadales bacterium]|jgi:hypothetical protein|nr:hypothetical protein [Candidatus Saccharimonadales bacterium]